MRRTGRTPKNGNKEEEEKNREGGNRNGLDNDTGGNGVRNESGSRTRALTAKKGRSQATVLSEGTTPQDTGANARERILATAAALFASRGHADVSIRDITREAGVNNAMISYYFGGKEGLYREIIQEQIRTVRTALHGLGEKTLLPEECLRRYVNGLVGLHRRTPTLAGLMHHELLHPSPVFEEVVLPFITELSKILTKAVATEQERGTYRRDILPAEGAYFLVAMTNYYFLFRSFISRIFPSLEHLEEHLEEETLRLFLEGMRKR
jgi:TetR/AcrR family transcriptional regulator